MNNSSRAFRYQTMHTIYKLIPKVVGENDKKVNTIISTNVEGKDKKHSTVNQKQKPSPVLMLWLV